MYVPLIRERVRMEGRDELFLVLRADYNRSLADVARIHSNQVEEDVPFSALFPAVETPIRKPPQPDMERPRSFRHRL